MSQPRASAQVDKHPSWEVVAEEGNWIVTVDRLAEQTQPVGVEGQVVGERTGLRRTLRRRSNGFARGRSTRVRGGIAGAGIVVDDGLAPLQGVEAVRASVGIERDGNRIACAEHVDSNLAAGVWSRARRREITDWVRWITLEPSRRSGMAIIGTFARLGELCTDIG